MPEGGFRTNWRLFLWAYLLPMLLLAAAIISIQTSRNERANAADEAVRQGRIAIAINCQELNLVKAEIRKVLRASLTQINKLIKEQDFTRYGEIELLTARQNTLDNIARFHARDCSQLPLVRLGDDPLGNPQDATKKTEGE